MLEEDRAIDYSQNGTVECENNSGRDEEEPGNAGEPNDGHYLDSENHIYNSDDVYNSQSSPLSVAGNSSMNPTEYQDWTVQRGETVASLLENCCWRTADFYLAIYKAIMQCAHTGLHARLAHIC